MIKSLSEYKVFKVENCAVLVFQCWQNVGEAVCLLSHRISLS